MEIKEQNMDITEQAQEMFAHVERAFRHAKNFYASDFPLLIQMDQSFTEAIMSAISNTQMEAIWRDGPPTDMCFGFGNSEIAIHAVCREVPRAKIEMFLRNHHDEDIVAPAELPKLYTWDLNS